MAFYICPFCETIAFERWIQLRAHLMGKHMDEKDSWPVKEDAEVEELPEGVTLSVSKVPATRKVAPPAEPISEIREPYISTAELSTETKQLNDLLLLHGVNLRTASMITNLYDKLDLYKDPRNLGNLLRQRLERKDQQAIVPILFEMFPERKQEIPYMTPPTETGSAWYPQWPQAGGPGYYPMPMGQMGSGYPPSFTGYSERSALDRYIEYQISKEMVEDKTAKTKADPEIDNRFSRIERALEKLVAEVGEEEKESKSVTAIRGEIGDLKSSLNSIFAEKEKDKLLQPLIAKMESMEQSRKEEMARLTSEIEDKKDKGQQTRYLDRFMEEKER